MAAAQQARQAAEVLANEQRELATRERAKVVALEQELLAARREIDALKGSAQTTTAEREEARRALAAAQQARQAAKVLANEQRELATRERAKVVALEQELLAARREIDALKGSAQTTTASVRGRHAWRATGKASRKSWPMSSVSWPRANAPKWSRWNRNFSRPAGKSTRLRAARKRPLLSVRRLGVRWRRRNRNSMQCAASRATAARRRKLISQPRARKRHKKRARRRRARQAAEVLANEQRELATRNSAKVVALEQELLAARREIEALKGSAQTTAAEREEARRALAAAQQELDATSRVARDGSAQARAVADKRERALEGQRQDSRAGWRAS